jgi:hypothetical protein
MAPPARSAAEPYQAGRLGGDAVGGHELLLLTHRAEEAERVHAEADDAHRGYRRQAQHPAQRHAETLAPLG